jgi:hypothetical protein
MGGKAVSGFALTTFFPGTVALGNKGSEYTFFSSFCIQAQLKRFFPP